MHFRVGLLGLSHLSATLLVCLPLHAQAPAAPTTPAPTTAAPTTAALTFDTASVKPASADTPTGGLAFTIPIGRQVPPRGLLTMTAPLAPFIMFAYDVRDEVEARAFRARLPEWARTQKYTIVARPSQDAPTLEEVRLMLRTLLEDRFALKAHRESHLGPVNSLVLAKPGVTGPLLRPHPVAQVCLERGPTKTPKFAEPEPANPAPVYCGLDLHPAQGGMLHIGMVDVTLAEASSLFGGLGGVLGGRAMEPVVDGTSLPGQWDITLDFLAERNGLSGESKQDGDMSGPTFTGALEKQLGLRLKKGTGEVEELIIDHIAQPTPD